MFYDSKIGNKSVSYRLNDPELNEEEKMKWLAEQKFASQSEYYSPYNYDAQKNFINGISNELISKSNESYAYRYGIASAIATLQGISVDQVLQNYDAYKAMYTGGVDLDDKSFASAFADSWKSESANRKIASLQNKYDKSTDEEYKEYLLEQIEKAEHDVGMLTHHQSFGTVGNTVVSSAPILRQGLRTAALSYAGGLAFSTLSMLATGTSLAGAAMNNFAWANTLLTASQNAIRKGGIKAVGGKLLGKAVTAVANPFNLGSTAGTLIDAYQNVYQTERGLLSRDIYNITDEYGNRVDDETRNRWSSIGGALIAFAEYMTPEPFLNRKMGGARFQQIAGDSAYAMVIDYVKNVALGAHSESVEEAVQSIIGDVAKDIALKTSKDGKFDVSVADNIGSYLTNAMDSYLQAFGPSLIAGGVGNLAGALVNTAEDSIFSMKDGKGVTMKETLHNFRNNFMASNGSMLTESQVINKVNTVQKPTNANTSKVLDKQFYDTEDIKLTKQEIEEYNNKYSTPESVPTVLVRYDETTNSFKALNEENGKLAKYLLYTKKLPGMYVDVVKNENIVMTEDQIYNQSYNGGGTYNADEDTITFDDYDSAMEFAKTTGNYGISFGNSNTADITVNMDDGTERTITLKVGNETENQEVNVAENNNSIDSIDSTKSTQQNGVKAVVSEDNGNQYKVFDVEAIKAELSNVDLNMSQEELDNTLGYVSSLPDYVQNDIINRLEKNGMSASDFITDTESFKKAVGLSGNENTYADKGNAFTIVSEARIVVNNKKAKAKDVVHELFHVVWNLYPQYKEQLKAVLGKDMSSSRGKERLRQFYIANFDELNTNGNTDTDGRIVGKVKSYDDFMKQAKLCANGGKGYSEIAAEEFMARMATVVLLSPDDSAIVKLPTQTKSIMQKFISAMKKLYQNLRSEEMPKDLKQAIWSIYDNGNKFTVADEETVKNYEEKVLNPIDENLRPKSISKEIQKIRDKYESYKSVVGNRKTVTLANGEEVKCHYKLVEADAPTASHNEITFQPTDGFPTNEEGKNINDRDYQNDKDAQQSVIDIANNYDSRALSNPPVVTKDGIVVSGNNRVMSSKRAVANKTDKKYIKSLKEQVEDFGFKEEDLDNFYHPRLVLEIDEEHVGDYTTKEFAKYNKDDKKTMSKVNKAISLGKQLTDENIQYLTQNFDSYESMGELYTDAKEIDRLIERLVRLNIISETDKAQYRDTDGSLSNIGKDFLETLLLGSVLNEDNIRRLDSDGIKSLRKKLVRVILPLVENKGLGDDYSINTELNNGVELAVNVLSDRSNGTIDDYVGQQSLLGDKRDYTKNEIYLAKLMTSKNVTELSFASIMKNMLQSLSESSSGQMDIFSDGIRSKQEIIDANLLDESMKFRYSKELDDEYMDAVNSGDVDKARKMVENRANETGFTDTVPEQTDSYKLRITAPPKKTIKAYKVFFVDSQGRPSALFVNGTENIPMGVWVDAKEAWYFTANNGKKYIPSTKNPNTEGNKTGTSVQIPNDQVRQNLVERGFLSKGSKAKSITALAYRPGWHSGDMPFFPQGGTIGNVEGMDKYDASLPKTNYKNIHRWNQVVFEVELDADKDYSNSTVNKNGQVIFYDMQEMPKGGYYKFATNPMAKAEDIGAWYISDSLKILRALSEEECNEILAKNGFKPQEWEGFTEKKTKTGIKRIGLGREYIAPMNLETLGYTGETNDVAKKTLAPITYDDNGNVIPLSERFNVNVNDIRYTNELDGMDLLTDEEIDSRFNGSILDPKNLIGRNIKSWSELRESDVEELVDGNRYVPESVLRNFSDNMFVIKELSDRESMLRLSSRSEDVVDIALGSANTDSFIKELRSRDIYTEEEMKEWEGLAEKFMSYVATVTPQEFASFFAEKYGSKTTTLDDLLALKSILGAKRIENGVKGDKKSYEIVSYKSELARTLNSINANSSNADIRRVADEISANSTEYAKEYAKALVLSDSVANAKESIKGKKFSPYLSSWLMVSLGDSVDNTLMKLRNDSNTVEYDSIQKDYAESENIEEILDSSDVVSSLNGEENSDMSVNEALREENKKSLDKQIDDLQKTVGRLTKRIDAYKSRIYRYEKLKERAKELRSQNSELFEKVSELQNKLDEATRSASYREWNEEQKFNAEYERLRKTIMYTEMFAKLDQKDLEKKLRAFYNEKLMKMRSVAQLKNSLSYNKNTQDVAYIDPVMKYLYKFINNKNDEYSYITCDDYRNTAMKRGEATEAESTPIVTYDFAFDDRGRVLDYYDVTLDYNPNSDRMDMSAMPKMLEKYLPPELAKKIKSNELKFQDLTSKDVNDIRTALYMVKHISTLSLRQKKAEKQNRRRTSSMNIFNEQMDFSINDLTSEQKRSIDSKIEASGIRDRGQLYTQNELDAMKSNPRNTITNKQREDYIRKNPKALFDTLNENNDKGIGEKFDQAKAMYAKMERVCTWMDGGKEGAIYNNVFRPLYDAYESKLKWVNKRNQNAVERINAILGSDKRTIEANKKALNEKKMFKSNTIDSDSANIELNGWEQIGVYIYAQNIYGFVKLISSGGNNISLEEVARINPVYTKKFVDSALEDRLNNRELLENAKDNKTAPKLTKDILNHVDLDTLLEVQRMLNDGTIPMESSLPETWTRMGDEMIDILGGRLNEFIQAGYREDNVLITLQDRYFPLYDSGQSNLLVKDKNGKKRVNTRSLNARSMTDNYPLRLNPLVNMFAEIENQEAIINMQSAVNDVHWILDRNGGNLKGVINMKYGKVWGKYFEDYVNMMANGNGNEIEDFDKTINRFIGNIAVSRIGLNLMTSIKQLVSLIPAMTRGELTIPEVLSALRMVTGNNTSASVNDFILENASSVFYSAYNVEAQSALKRDEAVGAGVLKDIRETSMWLTEKLDGLVKKTVWLAEYQKQIKKGTRHIDAVSIATQLVENTQSVTDNPSLAKLQMNKNPLVRLSFMFTNDLFQTWNMITYDIPNAIRNGNTKRALMESFGILLQGGVIAFLAGGWLGDEKDDDPWWSDFLGDFAVEGSSYLPIAGPFLQDLVRGYSSSFWQGPQEGVDTLKMIVNQCQYWATDGKMGKDYETPDWVNQAVDVTEELLISPTGAPVLMIDRMLKSMFPDGITEGVTEDANSLWYLLGSKYGKSMYKGVD